MDLESIERFVEGQAFLRSYELAPRPPPPPLSSEEGGGDGRGAESYDRKKA
jgi:hypothetical protein